MNITEDYVSFEVAKLLKEKGFNEPTNRYYDAQYGKTRTVSDTFMTYWNDENHMKVLMMEGALAIPTHQMAMKWLREEKNILIYVYPVIDLPVKNNYTFYWKWDGKKKRHDAPHIGDKHNYESFEQAVEAALKYSLENLI